MGRSRILVGTSSWADPGFVEEWCPPGLAPAERLPDFNNNRGSDAPVAAERARELLGQTVAG
jgi:hypothetical protein